MEREVDLQLVINALSNQISSLSQEKAYYEAIIAAQQEELKKVKAKPEVD